MPSSRSILYQLHDKDGIRCAVDRLNGLCRNNDRFAEVEQLCDNLKIPKLKLEKLDHYNGWFSGFFDGAGSIYYYFLTDEVRLIIQVTAKKFEDCQPFPTFFGGFAAYDEKKMVYRWVIHEKETINLFYEYIRLYPAKSSKLRRLALVPRFFELVDSNIYKLDASNVQHYHWRFFEKIWSSE